MSWNRFDAHHFMTTYWRGSFDSQCSIISSSRFTLNSIQILHTFQSKWCEQKKAKQIWDLCVEHKIFDCFRSVAVPNWKYIKFEHIYCKLKPSNKNENNTKTVIHHCCKRYFTHSLYEQQQKNRANCLLLSFSIIVFCNWKVFIWFIKHWMFNSKWPWSLFRTLLSNGLKAISGENTITSNPRKKKNSTNWYAFIRKTLQTDIEVKMSAEEQI